MMGHGLRALWHEGRPAPPPTRVWRDWALVGVVIAGSVLEVLLRTDRGWLPVVVAVSAVIGLTLLWRRTHPLAATVIAFGTLIAFDLARIALIDTTGLTSIAAALVLPYALSRWGSGREVSLGMAVVLVWLGVTHVADPTGVAEVVAGYGFFLFSAALGASIRFHATARARDIEQAKLQQRNELARDLHDTVGHHVSAIAVQAQAGQALAASHPERALAMLSDIEVAASRTLADMRMIVGVLRDGAAPHRAPQPGVGELRRLAEDDGSLRVEVRLSGPAQDLPPPVGIALYRMAQEAITNSRRHATHATRVVIEIDIDAEVARLTVRDDGDPVAANDRPFGFGLLGMRERATLLGGSFVAGPGPDRGWVVEAALPRSVTTSAPRSADRAPSS